MRAHVARLTGSKLKHLFQSVFSVLVPKSNRVSISRAPNDLMRARLRKGELVLALSLPAFLAALVLLPFAAKSLRSEGLSYITPVAQSIGQSAAGQQKQTGPAPKLPKLKGPAKKSAAPAPAAASEISATGPAQLTTDDLTSFFDGMIPQQIQTNDIAGMVIAVVKDGKVIFAKGYGYSNLKDKTPVSPATTLFRVGSVSKLFTWTAVMQLVQQGKINLDTDINQYLDFHIPAQFGKPITMRDVMTHTPGFEEAIKDLITFKSDHIPTTSEYLKAHLPKQIFPPGSMGAYSNYGATLAGYVVQRLSGEDFDSYIEHHIFQPLGMTHATFRQPLPPNFVPDMSQGFLRASGGAKPFEIVVTVPAGALSVSALDITHFMIAHLENGTYNGAQILDSATLKEMHSRQYAPDPHVNGMCLGFYEDSRNGHRVIAHGGDTVYFHSDLHLILDADTGIFVSYNSLGKAGPPRGPLYDAFMDRYFPYKPPTITSVSTASADARAVSGTYIPSRRPQTNILYTFALLGETSVSPGKDGTLTVAGMNTAAGVPIEWQEESQNVWYEPSNPQNKIAFSKGANGRWQLAGEFPAEVLQQVPFYASKGFFEFLLVCSLVLFALTLILWPIAALIRWHYGQQLLPSRQERTARKWTRIASAFNLACWLLFLGTVTQAGSHLNLLSSSADPWFRFIQIVGWLGIIAIIVAFWKFFAVRGVAGRWWWNRIYNVLMALAFLSSLWLLWFTHLLHFSLKY